MEKVSDMHLLIDADPIVYRCGFASEALNRGVVFEGENGPEMVTFSPKDGKTALKQRDAWLEKNDVNVLELFDEVVPEPLRYALATVKHMLEDCVIQTQRKFKLRKDQITTTCYLTGPGNFREAVATVKPYKGNRDASHKPYHYSNIRNYLQRKYHAVVVEGREADDAVASEQYQNDNTIICTFDKDLDMVPGWHYDYHKHTFYFVTPDEGMAFFYQQVLSGDPTDNIPGCFRIGKDRAAKIVQAYLEEHGPDWKGLWNTCVMIYETSAEQYGEACPYWDRYNEVGAEGVALEMARLVWMQEYPEQLWTPPGQPDELLSPELESDAH